MLGGTATLEEMIASTQRGIPCTRFWYIRGADQRTILFTGLTRDGTFLIENGKVTRPIKNIRWNESPIFALNNLEMLGRPERVSSSESGNGATNAPANLLSLDGQLYQFTMTFSPARCDRVRNTTSMLANVRALTDLCVGYSESSPRWSSDQEA